jgi:hypothetical protein
MYHCLGQIFTDGTTAAYNKTSCERKCPIVQSRLRRAREIPVILTSPKASAIEGDFYVKHIFIPGNKYCYT